MDGRRDNLTRVFLVVNEARDELTHFSKWGAAPDNLTHDNLTHFEVWWAAATNSPRVEPSHLIIAPEAHGGCLFCSCIHTSGAFYIISFYVYVYVMLLHGRNLNILDFGRSYAYSLVLF